MSNNDAGLSRDALIEKVAGLIDDQYDDYSPQYNAAGVCVSSGLAAAALDAVLSAVADDLEAHKDAWIENVDYLSANGGTQVGIDQAAGSAMALGVDAERVRGLLGKDGK